MKVNFKKVFKRAVMSALALSMISKSVFAFSISPASVEVEIGTKQTFEIMLEEGEQLVPGSVQCAGPGTSFLQDGLLRPASSWGWMPG